jgi:excisionase family DNA binding protein
MKVSAGERRNGAERRKSDRRSELHPGSKSTKSVSTDQKALLTTREVGELLKVTQQTIKNYIYAGKLKSTKTPGGRHRIYRSDLIKAGYLKQQRGQQ